IGTPTHLNTFHFHDQGHGLDEGERLAVFAFDGRAVRRFSQAPGDELAAAVQALPPAWFGPLRHEREAAIARLQALGARPPGADVRALEVYALACACAFAGGDSVSYWDERVLPLITLGSGLPVVEPGDVDDLADTASVLHALVEVMPYAAPPGGEG